MKQRITILSALLCAVLLTAGCGETKTISLSASSMADTLREKVAFTDQLEKVDADTVYALYPLNADQVAEQSVYVSTGATAEEISVFAGKDAESAKQIEQAVQKRLKTQKDGFADYLLAEMDKLNQAVVVTEGQYVIFCVANDADQVRSVIDSFLS